MALVVQEGGSTPPTMAQHLAAGDPHTQYLLESLFNAQTILAAVSDNTPVPVTVAEQTLVGRITGGNVASLTISQIWTLIGMYASMFEHENATPLTIEDQNDWHLLVQLDAGIVSSLWSAHQGGYKTITAYATSDAGAKTQVTSALHGMANGDVVSISGTTSYDGVWVIEQVATNTFVIPVAYVADDGASEAHWGSHLKASGAASTGKYQLSISLTLTPSNNNDNIEFSCYQNGTYLTKIEGQVHLGTAADYQVVSGVCLVDYVDGDVITVAIKNLSGGANVTVRNANVVIVRVG